MTIEELFLRVTFSTEKNKRTTHDSFFEVKLLEVESFRNYIFDIQRIKKYLVQVAPLPFDPDQFSFHNEIKNYLTNNIPQYGEYKITINGEQLFRPYKDELLITNKQRNDQIESIELFSLRSGENKLAYGWYGCRRALLGSIRKGEAVSGLRVKVGNLQVGDQHLLDRCFRENRFNSYFIGEIHVCSQSLLPNSRRDDFVDNKEKTPFYNLIEREVGLPLSKKIRHQSRINTHQPKQENSKNLPGPLANPKMNNRNNSSKNLSPLPETVTPALLEKLFQSCADCQTLQQFFADNFN